MKRETTRMSLSFCVLGSGSKGNCTLLVLNTGSATRFALIDCGLSPRQTKLRLATLGVGIEQISDVLLTHLDSDHYNSSWSRLTAAHDITVHVHHRHRSRALKSGITGQVIQLFDEPFTIGEANIEPVLFAHDSLGTAGFVIQLNDARLGWATDLGRIPRNLLERFTNLHALAIESNYDPHMQLNSPRPQFLKQRIMGGSGHISNEESFRATMHIAEQSSLDHLVTLHLSQQCNDPRIVKQMYAEQAPHLLDKLTISSQQHPTPMLHINNGTPSHTRDGEQLAMF